MTVDINNFYLHTPLDRPEYMRILVNNPPEEIMEDYEVNQFVRNGFVYFDIMSGMYGLPHMEILTKYLP